MWYTCRKRGKTAAAGRERGAGVDILQFDKLHCKNCYKCVRHCPVKAIEVKNHRAQINAAECILCGECVRQCPEDRALAITFCGKRVFTSSRLKFMERVAAPRRRKNRYGA